MKKPRILIVEPIRPAGRPVSSGLGGAGVARVRDVPRRADAALEKLRGESFDLAIVNVDADPNAVLELLERRAQCSMPSCR